MGPTPQQIGGGHFRDLSPDWVLGGPATALGVAARDVAAAWLQYRLARIIWAEIRKGKTSLKSVSHIMGGSTENQRKKLSGEAWASVSDLTGWALAYVPDLAALQMSSTPDLFPPAFGPLVGGFHTGEHRLPDLTDRASVDSVSRLRALDTTLGEHRVGYSLGTLTSEALRHFLAQHLVTTGVDASTITATDSGSRTIARLDINILGTRTQMDAVVVAPPRGGGVASDLVVHNALARAANDTGADQTVVVMMLLPGAPPLAQMLPGIDRPHPHHAQQEQTGRQTATAHRCLLGPLTIGDSGSGALREWWLTNRLDATVHALGTVGGATLRAFTIHDHVNPPS